MDIKRVIKQLLDLGHTSTSIAEAIGTNQPNVHRWKTGQVKPNFENGMALAQLLEKEQKKENAA